MNDRIPDWFVELVDNNSVEGSWSPDLLTQTAPSELNKNDDIKVEMVNLPNEYNERDSNAEVFVTQSDMF